MKITELLNGSTIEDVRRNPDGSVTLFCDSGKTATLFVEEGEIRLKPAKLELPFQPVQPVQSERMNLLQAFQGFQINYAYYDDEGAVTFVCEPLPHTTETFKKSAGHREVRLMHHDGLIDELPPVSAIIGLPGLSVFGEQGRPEGV